MGHLAAQNGWSPLIATRRPERTCGSMVQPFRPAGRARSRTSRGRLSAARSPRRPGLRRRDLLQRGSRHKEAAEYWRQYLANDALSEWAARARRSLKFYEMQIYLSAS